MQIIKCTEQDIEKVYSDFNKTLENLKPTQDISEPYSVVTLTGAIGLFCLCCDYGYIFMRNYIEYQGCFLPVTAFPQMVLKAAREFGMINNEDIWLDILETRNLLAHIYDEDRAGEAIVKIKNEYISAFEELKQNIDDNWLK